MSNLKQLAAACSNVFLGGITEECVIHFDGEHARIKAMDLTSSLYSETIAEIEFQEAVLGIASLPTLVKYLNTIKDIDVNLVLQDEVLIFKPSIGATIRYSLSEYDLIPTYNEEWAEVDSLVDDTIESEEYTAKLVLKQGAVSDFLSANQLFTSNSADFTVDKRGKISVSGVSDAKHKFTAQLGKIEGLEAFNCTIYGKHLANVLNAIDYNQNPVMHIKEDSDIIITTDIAKWILRPISNEM